MAIASLVFFCLSHGLFQVIGGQEQHPVPAHAGPWRHRIQWENNGQIHSLMSTGSEFESPAHVYVSRRDRATGSEGRVRIPPGAHQARTGRRRGGAVVVDAPVDFARDFLGWDDGIPADASVPRGREGIPLRALPDARSSFGYSAGDPGPPAPYHPLEENASDEAEGMFNDDSLQPHGNSVLYNMYPSRGRAGAHGRRPPDAGYGTRYFQNGLPDLVPDPYAIQAGAYVQRMQMFALRCAAEEDCLASSAHGPSVSDIDFRVLLRFPQKVKNQGTADFLPLKPRHQWDWHSCHQHYHSMEAFSNYDLLDAVTGHRVAEGHKASFCLEDTACDTGFRRRYACTAHTQGLSPGCHDLYAANIDCQWIDITDVTPGNYILKVTVNPDFHVLESDFTNNVVRCDIAYTGVYVQTRNCQVTRG
ncbi:protein-lysine 6-oxidase-like [Hippocampus comes]|uniref:protein-lysine 6-oxidase-like n=1 Tax=Hippocampus comes TaxID=109280 RepID=UPI00094E685B|nr:PREDICTED: protein-lysine 6-oxidase-like [Hippocampus comes]